MTQINNQNVSEIVQIKELFTNSINVLTQISLTCFYIHINCKFYYMNYSVKIKIINWNPINSILYKSCRNWYDILNFDNTAIIY